MNRRAWTTVAAAATLLAFAQFFAAFGNLWTGLAAALLLPLAGIGLLRFFEVVEAGPAVQVAVPAAGSLGGVLLGNVGNGRDPLLWVCPVLAGVIAALLVGWRTRDARRCALCAGRLTGAMSFSCPRCGLQVCEQRCWSFEKVRCRLCVQNHVPAFAPDVRWWDRNFGPATTHGSCQLCQATAGEAELRCCAKCGRPQCRDCWDDANGACTRCGWVVPALPDALKGYA